MKEYRSLLSNRILAHCSYETEREICYLEMLKLRSRDHFVLYVKKHGN